MMPRCLYIASDHAGFDLKEALKALPFSFKIIDLGPSHSSAVDYPDSILPLVLKVSAEKEARGLLICGSGIGMCIGANRYKGIRAMVGHKQEEIRLARAHNDINVLCLGARSISVQEAQSFIETFMASPFEGGRHTRRLEKLDAL